MFDEEVIVSDNRKVNHAYWKISFESKRLSKNVLPGQFINMKLQDDTDPFLRRPFSYYRTVGNKLEVLYEILGRGTRMLTTKKKGDSLQVLGPLGQCFTPPKKGRKHILVAGGVGVPPLVFFAEKYKVDYFLIGCKSKGEVLPKSELGKVNGKVSYATNDGSYGEKGFVTVLLRKIFESEKDLKSLFVQTCGPHVMMEAVINLSREYGVQGEASIDERMACGVGACLGCMVKTKDGYKTSCVEGPVFQFSDLVLE